MEVDKMHLKDESSKAYEDYETSEKFVGLQVWAYKSVIKFEQLYFTAKSSHMEILDGVLAFKLLNGANLTNELEQ